MRDSVESGVVKFIGIVRTSNGKESRVEIYSSFCDGLMGLEAFSHLIILYWFHERDTEECRRTLRVVPRKHEGAPEIGVFGSRSPSRPNPIGLCVVRLLRRKDCTLTVEGLDAIEGSPIIDIKPYLPRADLVPSAKAPEWTLHGPPT